jgi:hypothetical protein
VFTILVLNTEGKCALEERAGMLEEITTLRGQLEKFALAAASPGSSWVN